jgi:hypothetical protein
LTAISERAPSPGWWSASDCATTSSVFPHAFRTRADSHQPPAVTAKPTVSGAASRVRIGKPDCRSGTPRPAPGALSWPGMRRPAPHVRIGGHAAQPRRRGSRAVAGELWAGDRRTLLWAIPGLIALVYGVVVLVDFGSIITWIYYNSDSAAAPVLAHLAGEAPSAAQVVLGNHPYYEEYLFLRWTSGLSFYRQLWEVTPLLWSLLGLGLLGWSTWRALGRFAALLATSALVCVGAFGRIAFLTFDWHGLSAVHTIATGAALVWVTPLAAGYAWWRVVVLAAALGALGMAPSASDQLFPFWALTPMLITCLAIAWRGAGPVRARMIVFGVVATLVSLGGGALIAHVMRSGGVTSFPFAFTLVPAGDIVSNVLLTFESYMYVGGGYFFGSSTTFGAWTVFASGILVAAALVLIPFELRRRAAAAPARTPAGDPRVGPGFTYIVFWGSCLAATTAVYLATSAPVDVNGARYILAGYVAIAALLPLLAARGLGWRLAITAGVSVFALSAIYGLLNQSFAPGAPTPGDRQAAELAAYARAEHVRYGYGGYWDAIELSWGTQFQLPVFPVVECNGTGPSLCSFATVRISSWYKTPASVRTMLIVNAGQNAPAVTGVDPGLGAPVATTTIGNLGVYVFPYNIATKFQG